MKVALCYVFSDLDQRTFIPLAQRFVATYQENPSGEVDHTINVLVNTSNPLEKWLDRLFSPLACRFLAHNNYGKDIGAFQMAADNIECDLLVCMGSHICFHKPGWLDYIVRNYQDHGPAVYGAWAFHSPRPHIRTTCFWLPPELLQQYPIKVDDSRRYEFEHGANNLSLWSQKAGFEPRQLTWSGCFTMDYWHHVSRDESLFIDQHMERHHVK